MTSLPKKLQAEKFLLTLVYDNGQVRQIDVRTFLGEGAKAHEVKTSLSVFKTAFIEDGISITWANGFSLDPDVVYEEGTVLRSLPATASPNKKLLAALKKLTT